MPHVSKRRRLEEGGSETTLASPILSPSKRKHKTHTVQDEASISPIKIGSPLRVSNRISNPSKLKSLIELNNAADQTKVSFIRIVHVNCIALLCSKH